MIPEACALSYGTKGEEGRAPQARDTLCARAQAKKQPVEGKDQAQCRPRGSKRKWRLMQRQEGPLTSGQLSDNMGSEFLPQHAPPRHP